MKKVIRFSKYTVLSVVLSAVLILSGLFPMLTTGINFGIDFKAGLIEDVRIVPAAVEMTYDGAASVEVEVNPSNISLIISGVGAENETLVYSFADYPTVADLADAISNVEGVSVVVKDGTTSTAELFANSAESSILSKNAYRLYSNSKGQLASIDQVRDALSDLEDVSVKAAGAGADEVFQIRMGDNGEEGSTNMQLAVANALGNSFGAENIVVIKTMPGLASAACSAIDAMNLDMIVGTIAGDDTAFLLMRDTASAVSLCSDFKRQIT